MIKDFFSDLMMRTALGLFILIVLGLILTGIVGIIILVAASFEYNKILGWVISILIASLMIGSFADEYN